MNTLNRLFCHKVPYLTLLFLAYRAAAQDAIDIAWQPITAAERNMRTPVVEKDAGVEALFWTVHVQDEFRGDELQRVLNHYVRLKVFDEKGKEKVATIDLPFGKQTAILNIAGRTIKADGTELELKKDSVYQRDLVRNGRTRVTVKSFAMPGVEPGAIVEYRWKEIRHDPRIFYMRLQFQREFPVQKVTYYLKPLSRAYTSYQMSVWPFNCKPSPWKVENNGFSSTFVENVPAFREEPMMPGEPNVRPWVLVFYNDGGKREPEKYWNDVGRKTYGSLKSSLKVNDEIKQAASAATEGASTDEQKIVGLIRYLRTHLRNLYDPRISTAERAKIIAHLPKDRLRTSPEVFKAGIGSADELNILFAAMASHAGLEARPAMVASRNDIIFSPQMTDDYFLNSVDMAVKIGDAWKLYDISARLLAPNMVTWPEEGMPALLSDPKKPVFIQSQVSAPEASTYKRTARLALSEDGSLEGDIEESFSGHVAYDRRTEMDGESEARQQEIVKQSITNVYPQADVSQIAIENMEEAAEPLKFRYHVTIPSYATRTAKRILLEPNLFERGAAPVFTSNDRHHPIIFHYAWKETENITIKFPEGFVLDNADNPGSIDFGDPGSYSLTMATRGNDELLYERDLTFGKKGTISFALATYPQLKKIFEEVHDHDIHAITLKLAADAGSKP